MANKVLGKHPKKTDHRTLQLARYLKKLPVPPAMIDHSSKLPADIGMMGNDVYGDCTCAAAGHMVQSWTTYAGAAMETIPDAAILAAYKVVSPNDDGANMLDVLNLWRKTGVGDDKIESFVEIGVADLTQAKLAIQYFGAVYMGMSLPDTDTFGPWSAAKPTWKPNPYNGHCVALIGYDDAKKMFKATSWGAVMDMSYGWYQKYGDESYAVLDDISLLKQTGKSPEGFDWTALQDDLKHLGDPVVSPTPDPAPVPVPGPSPVPGPVPGPSPAPGPAVAPIAISAQGSVNWVVFLDGAALLPTHPQPLEAAQHADSVRRKNPSSRVEIRHSAVYLVK